MADSDGKPSGFTVTDKRTLDAHAQPKGDSAPVADAKPAEGDHGHAGRPLPPADFATLVISLGSSAMMCLGEGPPGHGKPPQKDLPLAKHTIDMLTVLETKTKGNLSQEEDQLLESLLFDLRLRYVEALKKK